LCKKLIILLKTITMLKKLLSRSKQTGKKIF
jgi:hypothetical protein